MKPVVRQEFRPNSAGLLFCIAVALAFLVQIILTAAPVGIRQMVGAFLLPVVYLVVVFVGGRLDGTDVPRSMGLQRAPKWWQAGLAVALSLACIVAFLPIASAVQALFAKMGYTATPSYFDYSSTWYNMLIGLVGLALLPALGEEAMCRGMAYGAFRQKGTYYGILMSALLFALWHGSPVQLVHQFLIGVVMALLVHFTRTVWTSVIFHFVNNAVVILYEFTYIQMGWTYTIPWWVLLVMFLVGTPVVFGLLWAFGRLTLRHAETTEGQLTFSNERLSFFNRIRRAMDAHGDYVPYLKGQPPMGAMYAALAVVGGIWLLNTVLEWVA